MPTISFSYDETLVALRREVAPGAKWNNRKNKWTMTEDEARAFVAAAAALPITDRVRFDINVDGWGERLGVAERNDQDMPAEMRRAFELRDAERYGIGRLKSFDVTRYRIADRSDKWFRRMIETADRVLAAATGDEEFECFGHNGPVVVLVGPDLNSMGVYDITTRVTVKSIAARGRFKGYSVKVPKVADYHVAVVHYDGLDIKTKIFEPTDAMVAA